MSVRTVAVAVPSSSDDHGAQTPSSVCAWVVKHVLRKGDRVLFMHSEPEDDPYLFAGGVQTLGEYEAWHTMLVDRADQVRQVGSNSAENDTDYSRDGGDGRVGVDGVGVSEIVDGNSADCERNAVWLEAMDHPYKFYATQMRKALENFTQPYVRACQDMGVDAEVVFLRGDARDAVVDTCEEQSVDLVVTGARGLGTVKRALLGSVSEYIVHHAHCDAIVLREGSEAQRVNGVAPGPRRWGVAIENNPAAAQTVFQWADNNILRPEDTIVFLHVDASIKADVLVTSSLPSDETDVADGSPADGAETPADSRHVAAAKMRVKELVRPLLGSSNTGVTRYEALSVAGRPQEGLKQAVETYRLDGIVMGSRGLGALKRMILGSVSTFAIHEFACPVAVVRGK